MAMPSRRLLFVGFLSVTVLAAYLAVWPVPIEPVGWVPPDPPELTGPYAVNDLLGEVQRLEIPGASGPEDVAVDALGRVYGGVQDGRILRISEDGSVETFAETGGRPLGLDFDGHGHLIVADADQGLLAVNPLGDFEVLSTGHDGLKFRFTNDVEIGADSTIYFSDASSRFSFHEYKLDLMEHRANGRLLAFDPSIRRTLLVLDDLHFANGVAVSPDMSFVLVVETGRYRVRRAWLRGPRAGEAETFIDNLPGFPDGISSSPNGTYWLTLVSPRDRALDRVLLPRPSLRRALMRLPEAFLPAPQNYGFVLELDGDGRVLRSLQDPAGGFAQISSVQQHGDDLYLGSLVEAAIGRIHLPGESQ